MRSSSLEGYPARYEENLRLKNGKDVFVRPIVQSDEQLLVDLLNKLSPDSIYLRFLRPVSALPEAFLHQLTHINYSSNFALAAITRENGKEAIIAVARYGYDPGDKLTDFAIVVRDDWQKNGLGRLLLCRLFAIGRENGISRFISVIDAGNYSMKKILRRLDCRVNYTYRSGATQVEILIADKESCSS